MRSSIAYLFYSLGIVYAAEGQVGIGTSTPKAFFNVAANKTVLFGPDTLSSTVGGKFIWFPTKGAVRFGLLELPEGPSNGWDYANLGVSSFASGDYSKASGSYAFAQGYGAVATGFYSLAHGFACTANGDHSAAIGTSEADGTGSFAMGDGNFAVGDWAFVHGLNNIGSGTFSVAFGQNNHAKAYNCFVIGRYNDSISTSSNTTWVSTDPVFIIGNGTAFNARNNAITVLKNGRMGLGTSTPGFTLEVIGTAAKTGGGSWSVASDARLKKDIHTYTDGLEQVLRINPVTFRYNGLNGFDSDQEYVGVVAQELQKVAPYMVSEIQNSTTSGMNRLDSYLNVDPSAFTFMLINAVKKQQSLINEQQQKIDLLEQRLIALENKRN